MPLGPTKSCRVKNCRVRWSGLGNLAVSARIFEFGGLLLLFWSERRRSEKALDDSPLKMLYLALYIALLDDAGGSCANDAKKDGELLNPCVAIQMKKSVRPQVDAQIEGARRAATSTP